MKEAMDGEYTEYTVLVNHKEESVCTLKPVLVVRTVRGF
jgi:hypothetical protein